MLRLLNWLFSLALLGLLGVFGVGYTAYHYYAQNLPDYERLRYYAPPVVTRLHAGDGRLLAQYAAEQRVFIPITAMPKRVIEAFLAAEDKDFYTHPGIDVAGIAKAVLTNIQNIGSNRRPIGASTITQQVAKNFLLTNEVSLDRKVKEIILAYRIEQALSKDEILELYLNEIFLGQRSYGVGAAALNYFNKSLDELTIAQAAYLGALPKAPNNYHPIKEREAAISRRNWVITQMAENGMITPLEEEQAKAEPLTLIERDANSIVNADYFAEEVRRILVATLGEKQVLEGGLSVRTSIDPTLQQIAEKALRNGLVEYDRKAGYRGAFAKLPTLGDWAGQLRAIPLPAGAVGWQKAVVLSINKTGAQLGLTSSDDAPLRGELSGAEFAFSKNKLATGDVVLVSAAKDKNQYRLEQIPALQGALVAMDPHTGRVLAMQGGFNGQISSFNRATQALRQPGSAFKPFIYLAALDHGFTPSSKILDAPFVYDPGFNQPLWRPENYSEQYYGPTTLRVGLEKSRNVMTVRLAHALGMPLVAEYSKKFGINPNMPQFLSAALGSNETTLLNLTTAYTMLLAGGKQLTPSFIDRIQDREGKTIWREDRRNCEGCGAAWQDTLTPPELPDTRAEIADPRTTFQMVQILEGVVQRGTAQSLKNIGKPLAGKTGTTNDANDVWFIGFSPDLVAGVFIGYDEPKSLGDHATGATLAVPIFGEFMQAALKDQPGTPFRVPRGVRLMRVNPETGNPAAAGEKNTLWEAFLPGTEPDPARPVLGGFTEDSAPATPANSGYALKALDAAQPVIIEGDSPTTAPAAPNTAPSNPNPATTPTPATKPLTGTGDLY